MASAQNTLSIWLKGVFALLAGLCFLTPITASAQPSPSGSWFPTIGQCLDMGAMERGGLMSLLPTSVTSVAHSSEPGPCSDDDDADPAHNICFDGVSVPISTVPRLLAQWQAEQVSHQVADIAGEFAVRAAEDAFRPDGPFTDEADGLALKPVRLALPAPPAEPSCTYNPEQCQNLPYTPAMISLASLTPLLRPESVLVSRPPTLSDLPHPRALTSLRIGPSSEHRRAIERPPADC